MTPASPLSRLETPASLCQCCVGIVTCLHLSSVNVDWSSVAVFDRESYTRDPVTSCFHSSVVYLCTSFSQLVECRNGAVRTAVGLPFGDGISIKELESATRSTLLVVQSQRNAVAVVDISRRQVRANVRMPMPCRAFLNANVP